MKLNHLGILLALCLLATANAPATVLYVDLNSGNPTPPFTNWDTAATNIQDAADAASAGDQILVTNGVYQTGGKAVFGTMTNRVAVDKAVAVHSVSGPEFTIIQGYQVPGTTNGDGAIRCVYLTNGASLFGFTLTNGATRTAGDATRERGGGGVWCESTNASLSNCLLFGNSAAFYGGGARSGTLTDCTLAANHALFGGGAYQAELSNCSLVSNSALSGGGVSGGTLRTCMLTENSARQGGGASGGTLTNCTLSGNWVFHNFGTSIGGGAFQATLSHCKLSTNFASGLVAGYGGGVYECTLNDCTLTGNGVSGTNASGGGAYYGVLTNCALIGNRADVSGYQSGGQGGGGGAFYATLYHCTLSTNMATGNVGDGGGVFGGTLYDCTLTGNSVGGYFGSWGYGGGAFRATLNNCNLKYNSAGGDGGGAYQAALNYCTLKRNSAYDGGGASSSTLNNCQLISNFAYASGGGAKDGTLINCMLMSNSASVYSGYGGGTSGGTLINCTLTGNSANSGGGASGGTFTNCIVYYNTATVSGSYNYDTTSLFFYSCTTQSPYGPGNIIDAPLFVDQLNGNLRLQSNSPCIGRGDWFAAAGNADLDGRLRFQGGRVDIGAYEFQPGVSGVFLGWLQRDGLPTDGSADYSDSDSDLLNNWQEWIAGTIPTDAASALRLLAPANGMSGVVVSWQSVSNRTYFLERATNLGVAPPFSLLTSNLVGHVGTTSFTDTNATGPGPFFYRVGVQP